ncbi:MAG: hypothetical protein JAY75_11300 [Candidatus Thiodiazotropha taylori]|nr:hypothetical protein [Candidatus Thiodiazotropha taylori]MCW4308801.1 hypothetical protein [Candidatus Thiodiazotropha endolucinida]
MPIDYVVDEFISRSSQDKTINSNGRKLFDFCKLNTLRVANGRIGADKGIGKYTYVGSTGSSVIDYVLVSPCLLNVIQHFLVNDPNILSDHCSIEFTIPCKSTDEQVTSIENVPYEKETKKYVWKEARAGDYFFNLEQEENAFRDLSGHLAQATTQQQINENISSFSNLMEKVCDPLFSKNLSECSNNSDIEQTSNQPWFDDECRRLRNLFYASLNTYRRCKTLNNQTELTTARSNYKKKLRQKRYIFMKEKTTKLLVSKSKNVKEYWKLLKHAANLKTKCTIDAKRFSEYFHAISDPNDRFYQPDEDILYFNERYIQGEL